MNELSLTRSPTAARPLLGLTILVVEDSRFACEAMRLLCLRSGARIRRADCLASARRHLQVYRPSVVIVDMGLPDGSGETLIAELDRANPRVGVLLGISGDDCLGPEAIDAGADGFLAKPVQSLSAFQEAILAHLPKERQPAGPRVINEETVQPDLMAFQDDMAHAADVLSVGEDPQTLDYVAQFLSGVAHSANDHVLHKAALDLAETRARGRPAASHAAILAGLVQERLARKQAI